MVNGPLPKMTAAPVASQVWVKKYRTALARPSVRS
jgi:hypothetical protein